MKSEVWSVLPRGQKTATQKKLGFFDRKIAQEGFPVDPMVDCCCEQHAYNVSKTFT